MRRIAPWLLATLLALPVPSLATRGSPNRPKVMTYSSAIGTLPPATRDSLAWFDLLVCQDRPETIAYLRDRNPSQRYLWALLPQYVEPSEGDDAWWMPDTLWSIKRLMMVYAWKNDWYLRNVDGSIVSDGSLYLLNWTRFCPPGTFGSAKGLRASEWLASVALPTIALSGRFWEPWSWDSRTAYNGYMFEILADCLGSYYWQNYQYADPDRDGDADGVYSTCSTGGTDDPLSVLFREENETFYQRLEASFPPGFVFTINGNWDFIGPWWLTKLSGIKLENWMRDSNPEWVDWWDHFYGLTPPWEGGLSHGGGYHWAEQHMDNLDPDSLKGWDLSFIQVHKRFDVQEEENRRQVRWGLGTSMLGDGYFCYSLDQRQPLWPQEFDWDFGEPWGEFFRQTFGGDTLMVRLYEKGMVQVNPYAYAVGGVPARDTRFTFWSSVESLTAVALDESRVRATWTSPTGNPNAPESFDLRYAPAPITLENWDQAASYAANPVPADPGRPVAVEIDGLAPGTTYFLAVRGRYHDLLEARLSNPASATTAEHDLAPPQPPARVWIDGTDADGGLRLAWEPPADPDLAGYHVYGRSGSSDWQRLTLEPLLPPITRWSAPRGHDVFGVSALDAQGNESAPRANLEAALEQIDLRGPFPHPVRTSCRFEIRLPAAWLERRIRAQIFDTEATEVRTLIDEPAAAPLIELTWDRRDRDGDLAAPGFYLLRVEVGSAAAHRRVYLDP